jgi:hypothetical protein
MVIGGLAFNKYKGNRTYPIPLGISPQTYTPIPVAIIPFFLQSFNFFYEVHNFFIYS